MIVLDWLSHEWNDGSTSRQRSVRRRGASRIEKRLSEPFGWQRRRVQVHSKDLQAEPIEPFIIDHAQ